MVQLFTHTYPAVVAGVAMLDGFPNLLRLQGLFSSVSPEPVILMQNIHNCFSNSASGRSNREIFDTITASCGTLNMVRALESVGVSRALLAYYWSSYRFVYFLNSSEYVLSCEKLLLFFVIYVVLIFD
jgi:hypothetical protein